MPAERTLVADLVDQRNQRVHDDDGETHSFRKGTPDADHTDDDPDADSEADSAEMRNRRGHNIHSKEKCDDHDWAREQKEQRPG